LCRFSGSVLLIVDEEALVLCDQNTLLPAAFDIDYLIIWVQQRILDPRRMADVLARREATLWLVVLSPTEYILGFICHFFVLWGLVNQFLWQIFA
jgi:hypothetical protein